MLYIDDVIQKLIEIKEKEGNLELMHLILGLNQTKSKEKTMQDTIEPSLGLVVYTLRLDDAPSADGVHLSDEQRLSLLETVWESIPYKVFDEMLKKAGETT